MDIKEAIDLLQPAFPDFKGKKIWADLGCGNGLFTAALSALLPDNSLIYAVDKNKTSLDKINPFLKQELKKVVADFTSNDLELSNLDGILMANSLHFVNGKMSFIQRCTKWLKNDGHFLIVEYDTDIASRWVPYPLGFSTAAKLFSELDFTIEKIGEKPSVYQRGGMYAAKLTPKSVHIS